MWEGRPPTSKDPNPLEKSGEVLIATIYYNYKNSSPNAMCKVLKFSNKFNFLIALFTDFNEGILGSISCAG